ncbi:hypothetical protein PRUB_a5330 [Pseudoalteromonas rubra]|uniref:Uncharacterized protein n=1 Tax=Pseudoalteromonas rubra TaxID=43658 RepID=A0A8T0CAM9_9GAMM|nr:hypothetical protein PRUB_a5330 [Pseudoalteromonas rubra]
MSLLTTTGLPFLKQKPSLYLSSASTLDFTGFGSIAQVGKLNTNTRNKII